MRWRLELAATHLVSIPVLAAMLYVAGGIAHSAQASSQPSQPAHAEPGWSVSRDDWAELGVDFIGEGPEALILGSAEYGATWGVEASSGRVLWSRDGRGHSLPTVLADGDFLIEVSLDAVARLDGRSGKVIWQHEVGGYLSDDSYVAVADKVSCIVHHGDSLGAWRHLDRRRTVDVRTGKSISTGAQLERNPLPLRLAASRFVCEQPDLYMVTQEDIATPRDYTLAAFDARSGRELWRLGLGTVSWDRTRKGYAVWGDLGCWRFAVGDGPAPRTIAYWLDLAEGRVLAKDVRAGVSGETWPLVTSETMPERTNPEQLVSNACVLTLDGLKLSLRRAGSSGYAVWTCDLRPLLGPPMILDDLKWHVEAGWPFSMVLAMSGEGGASPYYATVLALDMRVGSAQRVTRGTGFATVALGSDGRSGYVLSGGRLTAYRFAASVRSERRPLK